MPTSHRIWLAVCLAGLIVVSISTTARSAFPEPQEPPSQQVAVVNGGAGSCTADFVVTDSSGKGIYAAKIDIQIRYGFRGLHKLGLTVSTNSDGKARIEGMPEKINKTADFKITHADQTKSLPYDPLADCHPKLEVTLGAK